MPNEEQKHKVTIFTTPTCPWCVMAKKYLDEKNIEYNKVDVSLDYKSAEKMMEKSGEMGVPQFWIDDEVVVGFNKDEIEKLLK